MTPPATASPLRRRVLAQTRIELALTFRQGERLLVTFGIPLVLLLFLAKIDILPVDGSSRVDFVVPGIVTLAVISTSMVSLGIATGFERSYLVLKHLGATPLSRPALLAAKTISVGAVEILQMAVLVGVSVALGWHVQGELVLAGLLVLAGTVAFAGLGLLMAGSLRAEATLAGANGLYLILLFLGGIAFPLSKLPGAVQAVARALPAAALASCVRAALTEGAAIPAGSLIVLLAWMVAAPLAAALTFRWEA
jgi:ABC-2 type transport system permease protein